MHTAENRTLHRRAINPTLTISRRVQSTRDAQILEYPSLDDYESPSLVVDHYSPGIEPGFKLNKRVWCLHLLCVKEGAKVLILFS